MLLAVDIGNTTIHMGFFSDKRIIKTAFINTSTDRPYILRHLKKQIKNKERRIDAVIISSVAPKVMPAVRYSLRKILKIDPVIVGSDMKTPIKNLYGNPKQVGHDRLVNAYACREFYGCPAIVIDFGTATTLDYVNSAGEYEGGIITAGIGITIDALSERTALLPKVSLSKPGRLIGKTTGASIRSGLFFGTACMCDGLILKVKKRYKIEPVVIATGGLADKFCRYSNEINKIDKNLTLKGLLNIFHKNYP